MYGLYDVEDEAGVHLIKDIRLLGQSIQLFIRSNALSYFVSGGLDMSDSAAWSCFF